ASGTAARPYFASRFSRPYLWIQSAAAADTNGAEKDVPLPRPTIGHSSPSLRVQSALHTSWAGAEIAVAGPLPAPPVPGENPMLKMSAVPPQGAASTL